MKFFVATVLFFLVLLVACRVSESEREKMTFMPPVLLERVEAIHYGNEWENVQSTYDAHSRNFQQNPKAVNEGLALVEVLTQEAQVTGAHHHYYPEALRVIDKVLTTDSLSNESKSKALAMKAGVTLMRRDFTNALTIAKQAEEFSPKNPHVQQVLVDCYLGLGHYESARSTTNEMISAQPNLAAYKRLSALREIHGDIEGSLEAMKEAIEAGQPRHEETARASIELAALQHRIGRKKDAVKTIEQVLSERPHHPFAKATLAEFKFVDGDSASAKTLIDEAVSTVPDLNFYFLLADYHKSAKNEAAFTQVTEEIKHTLDKCVESGHNMDLEYANLYFNLLDDPETALIHMRKACKTRPENIDVNREIALIYQALKKPIHVDYHLKRATRTNSQHPDLKQLSASLK